MTDSTPAYPSGQPGPMRCPKCGSPMRTYERNGVVVDQCTECKGIFLDRGELEALVAAESAYYGQPSGVPAGGSPTPSAPPPQRYAEPYPPQYGYDPRGERRGEHHGGWGEQGGHRRRKRSFLDDLFD